MEETHQPSDNIDNNKELTKLLSSISRKSKRNVDDINTITTLIENLNNVEDIETNKNKLLKILSGIKETSENIQILSSSYLAKNKNKSPDNKNDTLSSSLGLKFNYDDYLIKEDLNIDEKLIDKIIQDENKRYQENLIKNFDEKLNYDYSKCNFEESVKSSNDNNMIKPEIKNKYKNEIYSSTPNLNNVFNTNNLLGNRNTIPFNKNLSKNSSNNQESKETLLPITKNKGKNSYTNLNNNNNHNKSPIHKDDEEHIKNNYHIIDKNKEKEIEKPTNKKPNSINKKQKDIKENDICNKINPTRKINNINNNIGSEEETKARYVKQKATKVADIVMKLNTDQEINDIIVQLFGDDILDQLMSNDCEEFLIENVEKSIKEIERLRENDKPSNKDNKSQSPQISLQKKFNNIDKSQNNKNNSKQKPKNNLEKLDKNDLDINNIYFQTNNHCASVNSLSNNKRNNIINYECVDNPEKAKNENNNLMKKSRSYADELLAQNGLLFSNYIPKINSINSLDNNNKVVNNIRNNLINYSQANKNNINSLLSNNITPTDIAKKDSFFNSRLGNNNNNRLKSASNIYDKGKSKENKEGKDDKVENKECIYEHSFRFKNSIKSRSNKVLAHKNFNNYTSPHGNYFDKSLQNGGESKLPTYKKNVPKGKGTGKGTSNLNDNRNNFDSA